MKRHACQSINAMMSAIFTIFSTCSLAYFLVFFHVIKSHFSFVYTFSVIFSEFLIVIQSAGCASNGHCNMLGGFRNLTTLACVSVEVLLSVALLHATPVRNLLRHLHATQGLVHPFDKLLSRLTVQLCDAMFCRCCHSMQRMTFVGKSACRTELRSILSTSIFLLKPGLRLFPVSSFPL